MFIQKSGSFKAGKLVIYDNSDFNGFLEFKEETYPFSLSKNKITIHPYSLDKWNRLLEE